MNRLNVWNRKELPQYALEVAGGPMPETTIGIIDGRTRKLMDEGRDFVYFDHSYFQRGWHTANFRAVRNGLHLTKILDRPDDRMKRFGVKVEPWRKRGVEIIIIPPSESQISFWGCKDWLMETETALCQITDRPVICKHGKSASLRDYLNDAWAVVTYASVAGVEAALMGVPVFCTERCPSWPVNAGTLETIEKPIYVDHRAKWAASLCYASWNWDEMKSIKWADYNYELMEVACAL